jgi:CRISPR-associated protein Cas2
MFILIAYDVSTVDRAGQKRLRQVARACKDYGVRVQKSLFECQVGKTEWATLRNRLLQKIDPKQDSLRFYHIDEDARKETEHHGIKEPVDLNAPLVL